ncbi:MAG TPA: tRNA (adenosine(37)-N6)-threonylcarbamoyltransferase complex dimerization subunit type 1 TsaB [Terriglobales bacterium]|nr:tRNA (adenosine(37)-N6)-threonylcarbamoyltransferase complex dimerization subunit type 1 TsaB [Terriglobales bacterium]
MLVLGVDTSWKQGSIALVRDERVLGCAPLEGGMFSAQLVPQIARLLADHKLKKSDLDGFSVVSGPGSFTGLRVGLAAVKGLAEILHKPIAATTVLEAMAISAGKEGKVACALDAGRGEVFVAEYEVRSNGRQVQAACLRESVAGRTEAVSGLRGARVICCEGSIADLLRGAAETLECPRPDSAVIARIGAEKIAQAVTVTPEQLDANYIRRSDAEIFSAPKP